MTFSPASSGSVHSLVTASRAEFACTVHMPGTPAVERDQQVQALLLPHLADDDAARTHPQRFLDQPAQPDLAVPSRFGCRVCIATTSGSARLQLEDLLAGDQPLAAPGSR